MNRVGYWLFALFVFATAIAAAADDAALQAKLASAEKAVRVPGVIGSPVHQQRGILSFPIDENFEGTWPPAGWGYQEPGCRRHME